MLSHVRVFATLWTVAQQAPLSMGFSGQKDWNVLPFPTPGDLPDPGIEPMSPALAIYHCAPWEVQQGTRVQFQGQCLRLWRGGPGDCVYLALKEILRHIKT